MQDCENIGEIPNPEQKKLRTNEITVPADLAEFIIKTRRYREYHFLFHLKANHRDGWINLSPANLIQQAQNAGIKSRNTAKKYFRYLRESGYILPALGENNYRLKALFQQGSSSKGIRFNVPDGNLKHALIASLTKASINANQYHAKKSNSKTSKQSDLLAGASRWRKLTQSNPYLHLKGVSVKFLSTILNYSCGYISTLKKKNPFMKVRHKFHRENFSIPKLKLMREIFPEDARKFIITKSGQVFRQLVDEFQFSGISLCKRRFHVQK